MVGKKDSTEPTPAQTPSISREWMAWLMCRAVKPWSNRPVSPSMPMENQSLSAAPITPKVSTNTATITARKMGMAQTLWVSTRSMRSERSCSLEWPLRCTALKQSSSMNA